MNYLVIDFNHLIHRYYFPVSQGYYPIDVAAERVIREIESFENELNISRVIVARDASTKLKKEFFNSIYQTKYKEGRPPLADDYVKLQEMVVEKLAQLKQKNPSKLYKIYQKEEYEADDIVKAIIDRIRIENNNNGKNYYAHILCNDMDLLPLVDEYTSIWLHRKKSEYEMFNGYLEFSLDKVEILADLKALSGYDLTFDTVLLFKILRGDTSDAIPRIDKMTPTKARKIISDLTGEKFRYGDSLESIKEKLSPYLSEYELEHGLNNFRVLDLNSDLGGIRKPFVV